MSAFILTDLSNDTLQLIFSHFRPKYFVPVYEYDVRAAGRFLYSSKMVMNLMHLHFPRQVLKDLFFEQNKDPVIPVLINNINIAIKF